MIARLFNPPGDRVEAALVASDPAVMPPPTSAIEMDLLERERERGAARLDGSRVRVTLTAYGVATVGLGWAD